LEPDGEGPLAATIAVGPGDVLHFRYLATYGHWFDDPDADSITEYGSVVTVPQTVVEPGVPGTPQSLIGDAAEVSALPAGPQAAAEDEVPKVGKCSRV
jgi:hypothetical protein